MKAAGSVTLNVVSIPTVPGVLAKSSFSLAISIVNRFSLTGSIDSRMVRIYRAQSADAAFRALFASIVSGDG